MARFVAFVLLAAVVCATYAFPKEDISGKCGPNEVYDSCGSPCEPTCQNPEPEVCFLMCKPGCYCKEGFLRSHSEGQCVPRPQCLLRD